MCSASAAIDNVGDQPIALPEDETCLAVDGGDLEPVVLAEELVAQAQHQPGDPIGASNQIGAAPTLPPPSAVHVASGAKSASRAC